MYRRWARAALRNHAEHDLIVVLAHGEHSVLSRKLYSTRPDVIAGCATNGIKDGHGLRSPSLPPNPLTPFRERNSGAGLCNHSKQCFARVYRAADSAMHALAAGPLRHLYPNLTHGETGPMETCEYVRIGEIHRKGVVQVLYRWSGERLKATGHIANRTASQGPGRDTEGSDGPASSPLPARRTPSWGEATADHHIVDIQCGA